MSGEGKRLTRAKGWVLGSERRDGVVDRRVEVGRHLVETDCCQRAFPDALQKETVTGALITAESKTVVMKVV